MMFGAKQHDSPPPGYLTFSAVAEYLDMSRQNFYQSGLDKVISSYKVGAVRLYHEDDVTRLYHLLFVRRGLIALGILPENYPLVDESLYVDAIIEGEYDGSCPLCDNPALSAVKAEDGRIWCEEHGMQH